MTSYIEKILLPDEQVFYAGTLHWIVFIPGLFITAGGGLFAIYMPRLFSMFLGDEFARNVHYLTAAAAAVILLCGLIILIGAYIRQNTTELAITNRRIIAKYGFISRATFEIMISRITGCNFDQTILGRILGYGTIIVHGAGGDISPFDVVSDPQGFHKALISVLGKQSNAPSRRSTDVK